MKAPVLTGLLLKNYRSIQDELIQFENPFFFVGINGTGKSNIVDSLFFISDIMNSNFEKACEKRKGNLKHIDAGNEQIHINIQLNFGSYILYFDENEIQYEFASWNGQNFTRHYSDFRSSVEGINIKSRQDSAVLPTVSGLPEFSELYQILSNIKLYQISPESMKNTGARLSSSLESNGENSGGVLAQIYKEDKSSEVKLSRQLNKIVPSISHVGYIESPSGYNLDFQESYRDYRWKDPSFVSDGTKQALGLILAINQKEVPSILILEEPENNLHPGAMGAIYDLIMDAAEKMQVIVTTHSPDLLDRKEITAEQVRIVTKEGGATRVYKLPDHLAAAVEKRTWYIGQLLRSNALTIDSGA